jgi:hypothetical protein
MNLFYVGFLLFLSTSYAAPVISQITPMQMHPGDTIQVEGSGFGKIADNIKFGTKSNDWFVLNFSDTLFQALVPLHYKSNDKKNIYLTQSDSVQSNKIRIEVLFPEITKVIPKEIFPNQHLQIRGINFTAKPAVVSIGNNPLEILEWSDTLIQAIAPASINSKEPRLNVELNENIISDGFLLERAELNLRKILHLVLGGLCFFIGGLIFLNRVFRKNSFQHFNRLNNQFRHKIINSFILGNLMGLLTQSQHSVYFTLSQMIRAQIVRGRWLYYTIAGSCLGISVLPFAIDYNPMKHALFGVALGAIGYTLLRKNSILKLIFSVIGGTSLVLYGLHLIQNGIQSLADHPLTATLLFNVEPGQFFGFLLYLVLGAVFGVILQSSTLIVLLVTGVAQTSGLLQFENSLLLILGSFVSAPILALNYSWFRKRSPESVRFSAAALFALLLQILFITLLFSKHTYFIDYIVPGDPSTFINEKKVVFPNLSMHLAVGFLLFNIESIVFLTLISPIFYNYLGRFKNLSESASPFGSIDGNIKSTEKFEAVNFKDPVHKLVGPILQQISSLRVYSSGEKSDHYYQKEKYDGIRSWIEEGLYKFSLLRSKVSNSNIKTQLQLSALLSVCAEFKKLSYSLQHLDLALTNHSDFRFPGTNLLLERIEELGRLFSDILDQPELYDHSEIQYCEISINQTEQKLREKVYEQMSEKSHDSLELKTRIEVYGFCEQIGNNFYRSASALLETTL